MFVKKLLWRLVPDHNNLARDLAAPVDVDLVQCFHLAGIALLVAAPSDPKSASDIDSGSHADAQVL